MLAEFTSSSDNNLPALHAFYDFFRQVVQAGATAILLLMIRGVAVPLLTASLAAVTVQFGYSLVGLNAIERLGAATALSFPVFIFGMGALSLWVAIKARKEGWLD